MMVLEVRLLESEVVRTRCLGFCQRTFLKFYSYLVLGIENKQIKIFTYSIDVLDHFQGDNLTETHFAIENQ